VTSGDPHPSGVLYPSFQSAHLFQGCSFLLMHKNIAPRLGCGYRNTQFYKYATPLGWRVFFTSFSVVGIEMVATNYSLARS